MSGTVVSSSGVEGMRYLENLMDEVGMWSNNSSILASHSTTTGGGIAASSGPAKGGRPAGSSAVRDCLEPNTRGVMATTATMDVSSVRRSPSPGLMLKGPLMLSRSEDDESRYYGKGHSLAARSDSPGPIYDPPLSTFNPARGSSFGRSIRNTLDTSSVATNNSELVALPGSIGKQVESTSSNASAAPFARASRFNVKQFISRVHDSSRGLDSPAPTAYQPTEGSSTNTGQGAVLCGSRVSTARLFLSRAHTADCIGLDSPGPIYNPLDGCKLTKAGLPHPFDRLNAKCAPSVSFTGSRSVSAMELLNNTADIVVTNPACRCHVGKDDATGKWKRSCVQHAAQSGGISRYVAPEPFISHEHSKVQGTSNTPGPAYYTPGDSYQALERGPAVSFSKAKLSAGAERTSTASPGPKYFPSDAGVTRNKPSATFGSKYPHEDRIDRFNDKQFLGKAFAVGMGLVSPGPIYDSDAAEAIEPNPVAVTMTFKEKGLRRPRLFPGPVNSRFVSKDNTKENLGAYSPGPKYDTRGDISKEGRSFSVPRAAKLGQKPAQAVGVDGQPTDDLEVAAKKKASKKTKPTLLNPRDDYLSTNTKGPVIGISPVPASVARKRPESPHASNAPAAPKDTNFTLVETAHPAVSFAKDNRLPPSRPSVQPGPTQYTPNWIHIEKRAPSTSIGVI